MSDDRSCPPLSHFFYNFFCIIATKVGFEMLVWKMGERLRDSFDQLFLNNTEKHSNRIDMAIFYRRLNPYTILASQPQPSESPKGFLTVKVIYEVNY
jgi:hypothetical protein